MTEIAFVLAVGFIGLAAANLHARFRPLRICTRCGGTGELGTGRTRATCPKCDGRKRTRRWLAPR